MLFLKHAKMMKHDVTLHDGSKMPVLNRPSVVYQRRFNSYFKRKEKEREYFLPLDDIETQLATPTNQTMNNDETMKR
jgi:hypothetical protein